MLRRLELENFKGWKRLDLELAPITLLFGTNSSGKTGVLQSLLLLKQTDRGSDPRQHMNFGDERNLADFGSYQDLVFGHNVENTVGVGLTWKLSQSDVSIFMLDLQDTVDNEFHEAEHAILLNYDVLWRLKGDIFIERLGYSAQSESYGETEEHFIRLERVEDGKYRVHLSDSFKVEDGYGHTETPSDKELADPDIVDPPGSCYLIPYSLVPLNLSRAVRLAPHFFNFEFEGLMRQLFYLGPLRQYPKRYYQWTGEMKSHVVEIDGADTIATLISSERDDKTLQNDVSDWLRELNLVEAFDVKPTDKNNRFYEVTVNVDGVKSALVDVGFGVSQVLPVIALLFSVPSGSIVLLEQPELHLHPNAQSLLADLFLHVASERGVQLLVESHSEHLLRRFQRRIAEQQPAFANPDNIKTYFCTPGDEGLISQEVEVDRFGQITNWPENFLGDISGELHEMLRAALELRGQELERVGHRG